MFESFLAACIGFGLAAACGFRVFVPMFVIGVAARFGLLELSEGFHWITSWPALIAFGLATTIEIGAYHFPWLDNVLDAAAVPSATVAGVIIAAACVVDFDPLLKWSLAIIAGGGAAGTIRTGLAGVRLGSTATTGGAANPMITLVESVASLVLSVLSILWPLVAAAITVVLLMVMLRFVAKICRQVFFPTIPDEPAKADE